MSAVRPIIRQFGSKTRVAPQILGLLPRDCRTWVEVFCGTAALTLAKDPAWHKDEHLNDLNGEIVGLFRVLRDPGERARLCELVELTPWAEAEYKACRAERATGDPVEDARCYLVRSWQGMAGSSARWTSWIAIDRSTKRRPLVWADLPRRIEAVAERLRFVALHERPAVELVRKFADYEDTVLFVDPPYPAHAINSRAAYLVDMTETEHRELAAALKDCRCAVLMTMAEGTLYDAALAGWTVTRLPVRGLRNTVKDELIFMNYDPLRAGLFRDLAP